MAAVPPVQKEGFSYAGDSFFSEASNSSRHRRATIPELKAHFNGEDPEQRTAHWYEAQLLHYGLPPSKVKGTAHKRLFDSVTGKGGLTVPAHIQKIEADLKKEWNKKEREAKKAMKGTPGAAAPAKGAKRKAEQVSTNFNVNVSVQISHTGAVKVDASQPATKKAKTGGPSSSTTTTKKTTTAASKEKKTTSTKPQNAGRVGTSASSPKPAKPAAKAKPPAKPAARRPAASRSSGTASSSAAFGASQAGYDRDTPPPYSEFDPGQAYVSQNSPRRSIGLLNGRYEVSCPQIEDNFPEYCNDLGLIATLDGNKLWLKFDFGAVHGLMKVDRPYEVDEDGVALFWRGQASDEFGNAMFFNNDTLYRAGAMNRLRFLGDGHISGMISYDGHDVEFDAYRVPDQPMKSEVSPREARDIWAQLE